MNKLILATCGLLAAYFIYREGRLLAVDNVRGMRNKNPMNIKDSNIVWNGESGENKDPVFEEFNFYSDGIRAGGKLLFNYFALYHINTVQGLIYRWAPPQDDNPTNDYVNFVADYLKVSPTQPIDVKARLPELCRAIIHYEIGTVPFSYSYIRSSLKELTA